MCRQLFLLAQKPVPEVRDDTEFPDLRIAQLEYEPQLTNIRSIGPAAHVYSVGPAGLCGCYFGYADRSAYEDAEQDAVQRAATIRRYGEDPNQWVDRTVRAAVESFGRYAARHVDAELALYVVWESDEGAALVGGETVTPAFFGGASFGPLEENTLWTIRAG